VPEVYAVKAQDAREMAKQAQRDLKLASMVKASLDVIKRHAGQGELSCQVQKMDQGAVGELRKLGYKVESYESEDHYGGRSTSDTLEVISW
jgi:hypothetical protein